MAMQKKLLTLLVMALLITSCDTNRDICTGHAVGVITAFCENVSMEQVGYYIITKNHDSILVFDRAIIPEEYGNMGSGIYGIDYEIPYSFAFVLLDSLDEEYMVYEPPVSNALFPWMRYSPEDFKQAKIINIK